MPDTQDNAFMRFLNEKLVPFSTKVAQNKYIQAIGSGSMSLMAIIPGFFVALVFGALRFAFSFTSYGNMIDCVYTLLQTPLAGITGSLPGFIILIIVAQALKEEQNTESAELAA